MTTARDIIQSLGGPTTVARRLGVRPQAVSLWSLKNRIPAERVPALEAFAREVGANARAEAMRPDLDWAVLRQCEVCS